MDGSDLSWQVKIVQWPTGRFWGVRGRTWRRFWANWSISLIYCTNVPIQDAKTLTKTCQCKSQNVFRGRMPPDPLADKLHVPRAPVDWEQYKKKKGSTFRELQLDQEYQPGSAARLLFFSPIFEFCSSRQPMCGRLHFSFCNPFLSCEILSLSKQFSGKEFCSFEICSIVRRISDIERKGTVTAVVAVVIAAVADHYVMWPVCSILDAYLIKLYMQEGKQQQQHLE